MNTRELLSRFRAKLATEVQRINENANDYDETDASSLTTTTTDSSSITSDTDTVSTISAKIIEQPENVVRQRKSPKKLNLWFVCNSKKLKKLKL